MSLTIRTLRHDTTESEESEDPEDEEDLEWWDREDTSAQWMTQATRLTPNTTLSLWQFTP